MARGERRRLGRLPLPLRLAVRADGALSAIGRWWTRLVKRRRREPLVVLVRNEWRLGDEVMALPVFAAQRRRWPRDRMVARVDHPQLLAGNPHVDEVNPLTVRPDLIVDLKGEEPGEARRVTLGRRAGVSLDEAPRVHLREGERALDAVPELAGAEAPVVVLHPASTQPCKGWGRERWLAVAAHLGGDGISLVEVGLEREPLGIGIDLVGQTDDRGLARVLARADLVVGEDSGPIHLALAVGTPAVSLFGPTDPTLLYPDAAALTAVCTTAACRACWPARHLAYPSGRCPLERHECMEAITLESVLAAVDAALAGRGRR